MSRPEPRLISIAEHPRAGASVRRWKSWGGLAAFALTLAAGLLGGVHQVQHDVGLFPHGAHRLLRVPEAGVGQPVPDLGQQPAQRIRPRCPRQVMAPR